jgi:hypothetical protein
VPDSERTSIDDCEEARRGIRRKKSKRKQGEIEIHDGGREIKNIGFSSQA